MKKKILAASMWPALTFADPNKAYQEFLSVGRPRFNNFLESILLYDEVHVPTDSFMSLTILVGVLGEDAVHALLDCGVLKFLRFRGGLAYIGNGGGLSNFQIGEASGRPKAIFSTSDEAIAWALGGLESRPN